MTITDGDRKIEVSMPAEDFDYQRVRGQDSAAKSSARRIVVKIESCFVSTESYQQCGNDSLAESGLPIGSHPGQVEVTDTTDMTYSIVAHSESGNDFSIEKLDDWSLQRTCTAAVEGGCDNGTW